MFIEMNKTAKNLNLNGRDVWLLEANQPTSRVPIDGGGSTEET